MRINFFLMTAALFFAVSIQAQNTSKDSKKTSVEMEGSTDPLLSITPEQMNAIRQLEAELEEKEARKKAGDITYKSDLSALMAEREGKLKKILTAEQWARYEALNTATKEASEALKEERINKAHPSSTKLQTID